MPLPQLHTKQGDERKKEDVCVFAQTNFRNQVRRFGIKLDDRRRHTYVIGKTGMGKTTLLENMVLQDIYKGHGVGLVDPHGDFAEKIIDFIPPSRINDVVYLNPSDLEHPIGFNILEVKNEEQKHLIVGGLMGTFKKIWPDVWSARMEYILNNTLLALLDYPGSTLLGINRLLSDKKYRARVVAKIKDPVVKAFWQQEFASYNERYATEAVAPIQNKIGQFLSANVIRNMVAQVTSTINIRDIMDTNKILIMNLSKGRIGEDNCRLLGGMLITKIQLAAMERVDTLEKDRKDFFLYVDEFQNFANPSFANILSEARKYRLSLIMAHQYIKQLDEIVADAVFGNVGTLMAFRVGGGDAESLVKEFEPVYTEQDLVNLAKYRILLKLMIDGLASQPFSALTLGPIGSCTHSSEKVVRVSRERYGRERDVVEDKIARWTAGDNEEDIENETPRAPLTIHEPEEKKPVVNPPSRPPAQTSPPPRPIVAPRPMERPVQNIPPKPAISLNTLRPREPERKAVPQSRPSPTISFASHPSGIQTSESGSGKKKRKRKRNKNNGSVGGQFFGTTNNSQTQHTHAQGARPPSIVDTKKQEDHIKQPQNIGTALLNNQHQGAPQQSHSPKPMSADEVIRFDDAPKKQAPPPSKDDLWDDAWRDDK